MKYTINPLAGSSLQAATDYFSAQTNFAEQS
jgi:hypothetical protein